MFYSFRDARSFSVKSRKFKSSSLVTTASAQKSDFKLVTTSVTPSVRSDTICTAVIAIVVCLGHDNLTEHIPLQVGFEFNFPFPRFIATRESSQSYYLTHN